MFFGTPEEIKKCTIPEVQMLLKVLEEKALEAAKAEAEAKALSIKEALGGTKKVGISHIYIVNGLGVLRCQRRIFSCSTTTCVY